MLRVLLKLIITHKRLSLAILLLLGLAGFAYYVYSTQEPEPAVVVNPKREFADILPGQSRHDDIIEVLGAPQRVYEEGVYTVYAYPSTTSYYMPDLLYVKNDVLQMKELHYSPRQFIFTKEKLVQQYGAPNKSLYMPGNAYLDYIVYIYESAGVAAYVDSTDNVFKLRYFTPSTLDDYVARWDSTLLKTKPTPQPEKHE